MKVEIDPYFMAAATRTIEVKLKSTETACWRGNSLAQGSDYRLLRLLSVCSPPSHVRILPAPSRQALFPSFLVEDKSYFLHPTNHPPSSSKQPHLHHVRNSPTNQSSKYSVANPPSTPGSHPFGHPFPHPTATKVLVNHG